ncbi:MAG: 2-hydroxyacyl-CoA dehydratase [Planctomycetes bacterium]|nr:2-hydroxyacyl-CoA dehydratase [Planctomycetota bacterium]
MPQSVSLRQWDAAFLPWATASKGRFLARYGPTEWRSYLRPPSHWAAQGDRRLARLRYDLDPASLGLCALVESQTERLHARARAGARVIAAMKDLSVIPIFTALAADAVCFYADMAYMQPCTSEDPRFLKLAAERGLDETMCDVRAVVGALVDGEYWPRPDLCVGAVGACCDDFSVCMQHVQSLGHPFCYWEIPPVGAGAEPRDRAFVVRELARVRCAIEGVLGRPIPDAELAENIRTANRLRRRVRRIRELAYARDAAPLPALETLLVEAIPADFASDLEAALELYGEVEALCRRRVERGEHAVDPAAVRLMMVTPSMDLCLQNVLEDLGARVAGTEYMLGHAYREIPEALPPLEALATNVLENPMIGSAVRRAEIICADAEKYAAEGVVVVSFFGASHCAYENRILTEAVRERLGLPTVVLNCQTVTNGLPEPVRNRLEAAIETIRARRTAPAHAAGFGGESAAETLEETVAMGTSCCGAASAAREANGAIFARLRSSIQEEIALAAAERARGRKLVGIYCEYSPRELILAAGALPVCLCGFTPAMVTVAEADLPANLCPIIKSSYGYIRSQGCPFFESADAIVAETTCDGKKKMYELIRERHPMFILELTQKPDSETAFRHWHAEVEGLKHFLERTLEVEITDEALRAAIRQMNARRERLLGLGAFTKTDKVYLRGVERLLVNQRIACTPLEDELLDAVYAELERRRAADEPVACPTAPRILVTGVPIGPGVEKVVELIERAGGAVVVQEACTGVKPQVENVAEDGDPLRAVALKYFHLPCSCFTPNEGRFELLDRLATDYRVQGVVDAIWLACHTYNVESLRVRQWARDRGLAFLKVETDYSPSDTEQLRTRIESFLEMIPR